MNIKYSYVMPVSGLAALPASALTFMVQSEPLPNIVWVMVEDIGCDFSCYGRSDVQTPNFDRLAEEGLRLQRGYVTNPICSPSRSSMITGMYQATIDAQDHRSHRSDDYMLPTPVKPITDYLHEAGYYCAIGCGYYKKTDFNFQTSDLFDGEDWSGRANGQPFFAHITIAVTHRMYFDLDDSKSQWSRVRENSSHPVDVNSVDIPPYFPDTSLVRKDWALYLDQLEETDRLMGELMTRLDQEGLTGNTLVIVMGDNGRCHVRGKGFLYEDGIRVPMILRWPGHIQSGGVSDELVSSIDLSAQVLAVAGIPIPAYMQGRAFLKPGVAARKYVFAARDRWDEITDKIRCVVGERYKYIRNDMPEVPWDAGYRYLELKRPTLPELRQLYNDGELTPEQASFMDPEKPEEELYDLQNDPWELYNLVQNAGSQNILQVMRSALNDWEQDIMPAYWQAGDLPSRDGWTVSGIGSESIATDQGSWLGSIESNLCWILSQPDGTATDDRKLMTQNFKIALTTSDVINVRFKYDDGDVKREGGFNITLCDTNGQNVLSFYKNSTQNDFSVWDKTAAAAIRSWSNAQVDVISGQEYLYRAESAGFDSSTIQLFIHNNDDSLTELWNVTVDQAPLTSVSSIKIGVYDRISTEGGDDTLYVNKVEVKNPNI